MRTHPETGRRSIYVNKPFTMHIEDMEPEREQPPARRCSSPRRPCRSTSAGSAGAPDSFALWDNRCTQHYAVPDFFPQHRRMERVTVIGDRPR